MEVAVYNIKGEDTGRKITLNDEIFARDLSEGNAEHTLYLDVKQFLATSAKALTRARSAARFPVPHVSSVVRRAAVAHVVATSTLRFFAAVPQCSVRVPATIAAR